MTSENMMAELRRIVGAYVGQRAAAVAVAAKEGAKTSRPAEKAAAFGRLLDELCMAFDIDPWEGASGEGDLRGTRG